MDTDTSENRDSAVTLINVIEIAADEVESFVAGWHERAEFMRTKPGFRDYQLHRALLPDSRFQLINIARWDSVEAFRAATADPEFLRQVQAVGDRELHLAANPALYRVVLSGDAANTPT
jgi:heme oxygenase (mycobilin-producing)